MPDTNFLLTLLPIALAMVVAAILIVAAFSWLNTSRRADQAESEVEQLRIEKDQEHVAKHLALTERESALRAFRAREDEITLLNQRLTDSKAQTVRAEAAFRAEEQRRIELERLSATRLELSGTADGGPVTIRDLSDETVAALTADLEHARGELALSRAEAVRQEARLAAMDDLKLELDRAKARLIDAQAATQREVEKVARIGNAASDALLTETRLNEARARISALEAEVSALRAQPGTAALAGPEPDAHARALEAAVAAGHAQLDALNARLAQREAQLAAQRADSQRQLTDLRARLSAAPATPAAWEGERAQLLTDLAAARAAVEHQAETVRLAALSAPPDRSDELSALATQLAAARAEIEAAHSARATEARTRDEEIARLTGSLDALRQQASAPAVLPVDVRADDLSTLREALETARADAADQDARITLLRQEIADAQQQTARQAEAFAAERKALTEATAKANAEAQDVGARLAGMATTVAALEARVKAAPEPTHAEPPVAAPSPDLADARARIDALEQTVVERERRIAGLTAEIESLERADGTPPQAAAEEPAQDERDFEIADLRRQLSDSVGDLRRAMDALAERDNELTQLRARVEGASRPAAAAVRLQASAAETPVAVAASGGKDDALEEIVGIGPTIARRLRMAGIRTYQQVAATSPDRLEEIA
ncbi:MAG: hypothetical protein K1X39_13590, partial [Thermoflexales bacterium]|nr:hypothetical protein [Thermoflexales bacterium]